MYDLNKNYSTFIHAGKAIDPRFIEKLHYLHQNGMTLANPIITLLENFAKNDLH